MSTDVVTIDMRETFDVVTEWLISYIARPHEKIGRPGAVCPFVGPARQADALRTVVRLVGPAASLSLLTEIVRCGLDEFDQVDWRGAKPNLRALMIVLPDLPRKAFGLLDEAHALVKSESVDRGLMIGQFHPLCDEPAARNPDFRVSRSPVPLVVVRSMAVHDILFLGDRADWFAQYRRRFGIRHRFQSNGIDPMLTALALTLHGPASPPDTDTPDGSLPPQSESAVE